MWFLQEGMTLETALVVIAALLVTIFVILPIHEWAHGFVAYKLGDTTAKNSGRLTLNPLKHIDPLGASALLLFKFGWARPVPVDPRNFKRPKLGMALTALAGPLSNLIVAVIAFATGCGTYVACGFIEDFYMSKGADVPSFIVMPLVCFITLMFFIYNINLGLAVFNLLPLPPLDGSKILAVFLPDKILNKYYQYESYITIIVFALLFTGALAGPVAFFKEIIIKALERVTIVPLTHLFHFFYKG